MRHSHCLVLYTPNAEFSSTNGRFCFGPKSIRVIDDRRYGGGRHHCYAVTIHIIIVILVRFLQRNIDCVPAAEIVKGLSLSGLIVSATKLSARTQRPTEVLATTIFSISSVKTNTETMTFFLTHKSSHWPRGIYGCTSRTTKD